MDFLKFLITRHRTKNVSVMQACPGYRHTKAASLLAAVYLSSTGEGYMH